MSALPQIAASGFALWLAQHRALFDRLHELEPEVERAAAAIAAAMAAGGKLLLCGNGGSAADCQHIAAEFTGRFVGERRPLAAVALTTDSSALTSIANDYGVERIFERPLRALARRGDVLLAISTSGDSANVRHAVAAARELGLGTIGLLGREGGALRAAVDLAIVVPGRDTARIQEAHIFVGHALCGLVEQRLGLG